jgi:hypothetical protein
MSISCNIEDTIATREPTVRKIQNNNYTFTHEQYKNNTMKRNTQNGTYNRIIHKHNKNTQHNNQNTS